MTYTKTRTHERYRRRLRLRFRTADAWKRSFARDISCMGLFVNSNTVPPVGPIELEVDLPTGSVALSGEVTRGLRAPPRLQRIANAGFAVHLASAPPEWEEYCSSLSK